MSPPALPFDQSFGASTVNKFGKQLPNSLTKIAVMLNGRCVQLIPSQVLLQTVYGDTGLEKDTKDLKNKNAKDKLYQGEDLDVVISLGCGRR